MRQRVTDLPAAAYTKAVAVLDEFDATAAEYVALLDTQRALLAQGNTTAVAECGVRGDALALRAAACGRRLTPFGEVLADGSMRGTRADAVRRRLVRMTHRATLIGAAAAEVAGRCERQRAEAGSALAAAQKVGGGVRSGAYGRPEPRRSPLTLDTRG